MPDDVPQVALVDLDDTLITSSEGSRQAMAAVVNAICGDEASEAHRRLDEAWARARSRYWRNENDARAGRFDPGSARRATLFSALRDCRLHVADMDGLLCLYAEVKRSAVRLADGAIDLLTALHRSGAWVVLVTNGTSREQRSKIARHGLAGLFQHIVIEDEAGVGKPTLYLQARKLCGYPPTATCIVVGDDTGRDGRGAELAGHRFWHVAPAGPCGYCSGRFDAAHVTSLRHVTSYIAALPSGESRQGIG
ncbi:MAG: HAD family hydrolase [Streptosporangiaceae bacterium]